MTDSTKQIEPSHPGRVKNFHERFSRDGLESPQTLLMMFILGRRTANGARLLRVLGSRTANGTPPGCCFLIPR